MDEEIGILQKKSAIFLKQFVKIWMLLHAFVKDTRCKYR